MSQTTAAEKIVIVLNQLIAMQVLANMQKERKASSELAIPAPNAIQVVRDEIVTRGPAYTKASWTLL